MVETAACVWKIESGVNCTPATLPIKRREGRRLRTSSSRAEFGRGPAEIDSVCQAFHRKCTVHSQDFNRLDTIRLMRPSGRLRAT
jgi:hypothetical protein